MQKKFRKIEDGKSMVNVKKSKAEYIPDLVQAFSSIKNGGFNLFLFS